MISSLFSAFIPAAGYYLILMLVSEAFRFAARELPGRETLAAAVSAALAILVFLPMYRKQKAWGEPAGYGQDKNKKKAEGFNKLLPLICFFGGAAFNLIFSALMKITGIYGRFSNETQEALMRAPLPLKLLGLAVLVPAAEELVWRGLLYGRLRIVAGRRAAAIAGAFLFAASHGNVLQFLYAFPSALILTACFETGNGLACPVLFHAGANLAAIILGTAGA